MTQKQEERWKATVMPVVFGSSLLGDGFEESDTAMAATIARYESLRVPGWVTQTRLDIVAQLTDSRQDIRSLFVSEFLIRAEVAIVGIQLQHFRKPDALTRCHQRLYRQFHLEALKPIVSRLRRACPDRKEAYVPLLRLYQLCRTPPAELVADDWEMWQLMSRSTAIWRKLGSQYRNFNWANSEIYDAQVLIFALRDEMRHVLYHAPKTWWKAANIGTSTKPSLPGKDRCGRNLTVNFPNQYMWLTGRWPPRKKIWPTPVEYREQYARIFLAALETECPSPDWMPRV